MHYGYSWQRNEERFTSISPHIRKNVFVLIDYGSNYGYFSTALAKMFKSAVILSVENQEMEYTTDNQYCRDDMIRYHQQKNRELQIVNNRIYCKTISVDFFEMMIRAGICVDYQLMMSFIHWLPLSNREEFEHVLHKIIMCGETSIIEMPRPSTEQHRGKYIVQWYDGRDTPTELFVDTAKRFSLDVDIELIGDITYRPIFKITNKRCHVSSAQSIQKHMDRYCQSM